MKSLFEPRSLSPVLLLVGICLAMSGCQRSPSIDIFGSFFPVWFFCMLGGLLITFVIRYFLRRLRLDQEMGPLVIIYPCMTALFSFILWLVFFP